METRLKLALAVCSGLVVGLVVYGATPFASLAAGVAAGAAVALLVVAIPLLSAPEEHSEPEIRHAPGRAPRRGA